LTAVDRIITTSLSHVPYYIQGCSSYAGRWGRNGAFRGGVMCGVRGMEEIAVTVVRKKKTYLERNYRPGRKNYQDAVDRSDKII